MDFGDYGSRIFLKDFLLGGGLCCLSAFLVFNFNCTVKSSTGHCGYDGEIPFAAEKQTFAS